MLKVILHILHSLTDVLVEISLILPSVATVIKLNEKSVRRTHLELFFLVQISVAKKLQDKNINNLHSYAPPSKMTVRNSLPRHYYFIWAKAKDIMKPWQPVICTSARTITVIRSSKRLIINALTVFQSIKHLSIKTYLSLSISNFLFNQIVVWTEKMGQAVQGF
jgi:hypothetical protein